VCQKEITIAPLLNPIANRITHLERLVNVIKCPCWTFFGDFEHPKKGADGDDITGWVMFEDIYQPP
jgi:hypothetical protein